MSGVPGNMSTGNGIKITMTIFSSLGLAVWGTSIGFMIGYPKNDFYVLLGSCFFSIPVNAGMIYIACRLIFLVMNSATTTPAGFQDLHQCVARMVAFSVLSFSAWVTSVVFLSQYTTNDHIMYHSCNYGFLIGVIVAGLAGGLLSVSAKYNAIPVQAVAPKYLAPQPPHQPQQQPQQQQQLQHSQAHYNPAYSHYGPHRI